jgi:hypothetical protein
MPPTAEAETEASYLHQPSRGRDPSLDFRDPSLISISRGREPRPASHSRGRDRDPSLISISRGREPRPISLRPRPRPPSEAETRVLNSETRVLSPSAEAENRGLPPTAEAETEAETRVLSPSAEAETRVLNFETRVLRDPSLISISRGREPRPASHSRGREPRPLT